MFGLGLGRMGLVGDLGFAIRRALFGDGEQGMWYDLNDLSTLFTDSAGTTPATWGDPIGRLLDKSGNGNHRIQSTAGSRPILGRMPKRGRVNLLVSTENVSSTAFSTSSGVTRSGTDTIVETVDNSLHLFRSADLTYTSGLPYTETVTLSKGALAGAPDIMQISMASTAFGAGQFANVNVLTGVVVSVTGATCTSAADPLGGWRFTYTATATSTTAGSGIAVFFCNNNPAATRAPTYTGSITADCKVYRMQTEQNSTATNYQHVIDSLGFNVTESGQPSCGYLSYNGSNQWMQTAASVNFSATDEMSVFAGVRKVSDVTARIFIELGTGVAPQLVQSFYLSNFNIAGSAGAGRYGYRSRGTVAPSVHPVSADTYIAPVTNVLTGLSDISAQLATLRIDGAVADTVIESQGTGNYGNYVTYFGARAGTSLFFNGLEFSSIIRGALTSGTLLTRTEQYVARQTPTVNL